MRTDGPERAVVGLAALVGAVPEGFPNLLQQLGFAVGLLGLWLPARPEGDLSPSRGLLAGLGSGGYFHRVEGLFWPSATAKLTAAASMLKLVGLAGLLDAGGNVLFLVAAQTGRLDVAAVISSLYPAFTALMAWSLLRERLSQLQTTGVLLSLAAIALIASG